MAQHVTAQHLTRLACLYVRQSTLQQVMENTESTSRQYALRERARALGWPRWGWDTWDWCWGWRFRGSRVTPAIGISSWQFVLSLAP